MALAETAALVKISVEQGDALSYPADVLAVKYAQDLYGLDERVVDLLSDVRQTIYSELPLEGDVLLVPTDGQLASKSVLFVGVRSLYEFRYREIRDFALTVLTTLAILQPTSRHVCLTLHGAGYGLDEAEAFRSEIAGLVDAITSRRYPVGLERVTIIENNARRISRMQEMLAAVLPDSTVEPDAPQFHAGISEQASESLKSSGYSSEGKRHVFVAMPFDEDMKDVFHYGIERSVQAAGPLCERADNSTFTGEVMAWVKERIATSQLMIADLSGANPNVYLEVGYAWGCDIPTVLVVRDAAELKFDVESHRCIVYKSIHDLELRLTSELKALL